MVLRRGSGQTEDSLQVLHIALLVRVESQLRSLPQHFVSPAPFDYLLRTESPRRSGFSPPATASRSLSATVSCSCDGSSSSLASGFASSWIRLVVVVMIVVVVVVGVVVVVVGVIVIVVIVVMIAVMIVVAVTTVMIAAIAAMASAASPEWSSGPVEPAASVTLAASAGESF